jgi:hypothetical protein
MKIADRMRLAVNRRTGNVILRADVAKMGSASQVSVALKKMQEEGRLVRIGKGVYVKAHVDPATGTVVPVQSMPSAGKSKRAVARDMSGGGLAIPKVGLKQYILDLARRYKVTYIRTYADDWAESVTRLAGDEVRTDNIENLLIAMKRAHKVTGAEMVQMLANYLREKERVSV